MKSRNRAALVIIGAGAAGLITLNACGVKEGGAPDLDVRYRCSGPPQTCLKLSASWTWGGRSQ